MTGISKPPVVEVPVSNVLSVVLGACGITMLGLGGAPVMGG